MKERKMTVLSFLGTREARLLITSYLRDGYSIVHALPDKPPLEALRTSEPDIALVEIGHPAVNGLETACTIHRDPLYKDLPVVGMGLQESDGKDKVALLAGCCGFIHYPLQADTFRSQIRTFLDGTRETLNEEETGRYQHLFSSALIEKLETRLRVLEEKTAAMEAQKNHRDHLMFQVLSSLVTLIEAKDPYLTGHSRHVTSYATSLAKAVGIDGEDLKMLERASLLHDIGKISIDLQQINKPGKLNDEDWQIIRQHPETGFRILSVIDFLQDEAQLIKYHHFRWEELEKHSEISPRLRYLTAIITLADAFDAMTTQRPYNKPVDVEGAVEEMRRCAGGQFSPKLVEAFIEMLREKASSEDSGES